MIRNHTALLEKATETTRHNFSELARRLKVSRQLVNKWKRENYVPRKHRKKIERVTKKAVLSSFFN